MPGIFYILGEDVFMVAFIINPTSVITKAGDNSVAIFSEHLIKARTLCNYKGEKNPNYRFRLQKMAKMVKL